MKFEILYAVTLSVALIFINYIVFRIRTMRNAVPFALRELVGTVTITVITSVLAAFLPNQNLSLFMQCLHYIATEWMLVFLLRFLEKYTGKMYSNRTTQCVVYTLTGLINVFVLSNLKFHHITVNTRIIFHGSLVYSFTTYKPGYNVHLFYCCVIALFCFTTLIAGTVGAVKLYRRKYAFACVMLIITLGIEGVCSVREYPFDFSLYMYIAMAAFFIYYSLYYTPNDVITKTLSYMVADYNAGVVCFDAEGKCIYANDEAVKLSGTSGNLSEIQELFVNYIPENDFKNIKDRKWNKDIPFEGKKLHCELNLSGIYDEKNNYMGCYFSVYDKTEDVERFRAERYRATHDSLTCLYSREYFYETVPQILRENPDSKFYIVGTDIKDFKLVNTMFGFARGNEILKALAEQLKASLPEDVICSRLVSDRFAFCISKDRFDEGRLRSFITDAQNMLTSNEFQLRIQLGIYEVHAGDTDVSVMCDRATMAVRTIKDSYELSIAYYDENMMNKVIRDKQLIGEFDNALAGNQFVMYLQPQVLPDGSVLGAEALVRWIHPEHGMISPGEFIPVFENSGLIHRLDQYIWELAAKKLREWQDEGKTGIHISVNISTKDFYYLDIYKTFTNLVEKYSIPPEMLKLEITETSFMMDIEKQIELLSRLQSYGFDVEIDDFGSGYSSLNMLKNINADVLKIDMGFLREIKDHERTRIILAVVIDLAKKLNMKVITEGVETQPQIDYLTEVGCDMFQGFYFSKPIPVDEFEGKYM